MSTPADHPHSCSVCQGTGWQSAPDIQGTAYGQPVTYSTVEPCTHHWANDEHHRPELITRLQYLARLTERADSQLDLWHKLDANGIDL